MKTRTKLYNLICLLVLLTSIYSCDSNTLSDTSTKQNQLKLAQNLVEDDPTQALTLLNSIDNPSEMSKDDYMIYITTLTYTKYRLKQDITNETAIFEAQQYFSEKNKPRLSAQASLCAGWINHLNGRPDKAVKLLTSAQQCAKDADENLIVARSFNNIGYIYFKEALSDSAIANYNKALEYFDTKTPSQLNLSVLNNLGAVYETIKDFENADLFFNKGLKIAKQLNNQEYIGKFSHNLGVVSYDKKNYKQALEYFHKALTLTKDNQDILKSELFLARVFNATNRLDSANYYVNLVKAKIPEITYGYTLKSTYATLVEYYKQIGDYKQAIEYSNLEKATIEKIITESKAQKLNEAEKQLALEYTKKEAHTKEIKLYIYWGLTFLFFIAIFILIGLWVLKSIRKYQEKIESEYIYQMQIDLIRESFKIDAVRYKEAMFLFMHYDKEDYQTDRKKLNSPITQLQQKSRAEWVEWANQYLSKQVFAKQLKNDLTENQILLLALCCNGYLNDEIAVITQIAEKLVDQAIIDLKDKIQSAGFFTPEEIERMLTN